MAENHEPASEFQVKKKVDESWKSSVIKEKSAPTTADSETPVPEADFAAFVSTLGLQALVALGEIPDAAEQKKKINRPYAQYFIDLIQMLSDKTQGNLSSEEEAMMQNLLYELRMKFVEKSGSP